MGTFQRNLPNTGLMDYKARAYDPWLGRFVQPDTIVPGAANPQAYNRYGYVNNNPINFNDPSGNRPKWDYGCCWWDDGEFVCDPNCSSSSGINENDGIEIDIPQIDEFIKNNENGIEDYLDNDCTNYGSKCWHAMGLDYTDQWQPGLVAWINTTAFVEYFSKNPLIRKIKLENTPGTKMMENQVLVDKVKSITIPLYSVVVYDDTSVTIINELTLEPERWDHLGIVVGFRNGIPIISEHSGPLDDVNRRSMLESPNLNIGSIWILYFSGMD